MSIYELAELAVLADEAGMGEVVDRIQELILEELDDE